MIIPTGRTNFWWGVFFFPTSLCLGGGRYNYSLLGDATSKHTLLTELVLARRGCGGLAAVVRDGVDWHLAASWRAIGRADWAVTGFFLSKQTNRDR